MAVAAHVQGKLILDIFGDRQEIECDKYDIKNNILVFTKDSELNYFDLIKNIKIKTFHIFSKAGDLKQSESGQISGVLNEESVLFVFDLEKELLMEKNVTKFDISNTNIAYFCNDNIILKRLYSSSPYHRSVDIYSNCYVFDNFCILSTRKSKKDNNHKIYKIDEEGTEELGVFEIMEQFSCKINKENTYILIKLATSYVKNSYFAHTELYLYEIKTKNLQKVQKLYNISDYEFVIDGFVVIFGSQPSNVINYDYKMTPLKRFPKGLRNQIYYNIQCSLVTLAGFGQLPGDIEIYDTTSLEKYAEISELGANNIKWDTNGTYFYVSTTKYLKEDNKITMYDYFGRKIKEEKYEALISSEVYGANSDFIPLKRPDVLTRIKKDVYVPPHLSNKNNINFKKTNTTKIDNLNIRKNETKKPQQETLECLNKMLVEIEGLQSRLKSGEALSTSEMNLLLKEDTIRNKIKKRKE